MRRTKGAAHLLSARARNPGSWLAHELSTRMAGVPRRNYVVTDLGALGTRRLMAHYRAVRPLCELNLTGQSPLALRGDWRSPRTMFPIERLFERYVGVCPARPFASAWQVGGVASEHCCSHQAVGWFNLTPDFLLHRGEELRVLDTMWRVLDGRASGPREKYGLKPMDSVTWGRAGAMALVYPLHTGFDPDLPVFAFDSGLSLWVLPLDP